MTIDRESPYDSAESGLPAWLHSVVSICFFCSGAAALIYQVAWLKALGLLFGRTTYAITAVLAAFMAGLALGSWWLGRRAERAVNPFRLYGFIELGIGFSGLASLAGLLLVRELYIPIYHVFAEQPLLLLGYRFLASFVVLLLPTTLMGGTYPVMLKFLTRQARQLGAFASRLYWLNTAGAITGAALAGFVLLWHLGLYRSILVAAFLNLAVATVVFLAARRLATASSAAAPEEEREGGETMAPAKAWLALLVTAATGFASMMYEISWTRILAIFLSSTTYAFTFMLMTFLLGITVGSYLFERWHRRWKLDFALLGQLVTLLALGGLFFIAISATLGEFTLQMARMAGTSVTLLLLGQFLVAFLAMIVPTLLFGLTFPLTVVLYCGRDTRRGARAGALYAVNTVGAIAGATITGLLLIQTLNRVNVSLAASGLLVGVALVVFLLERPRQALQVLVGGAVLALVVVLAASQLFTRPILFSLTVLANLNRPAFRSNLTLAEISDMDQVVFFQEGLNASVVVVQQEGIQSIRTDGKTEASSIDQQTQLFSAYLPLSLHPAPRRVLIIGFGSGATVFAAAQFSSVERVDCIEIEPAVVAAAPFLGELNHGVQNSPKVRILVDDARSYLAVTREQYDVIISEPSYLWSAGVSSLFTTDFYRQIKRRLAPDGLFLQWLPVYQLLPSDVGIVVGTLQTSFEQLSLWRGSEVDFLFLASPTPRSYNLAPLPRELVRNDGLRESLSTHLKVKEPAGILAYYLLDPAALRSLTFSDELNTDDRTILEYRAGLRLTQSTSGLNHGIVARLRQDSLPPFIAIEDPAAALLEAGETQIRLNMHKEPLGAPAAWTAARHGRDPVRRFVLLAALTSAQNQSVPALEVLRAAERLNPASPAVLYSLAGLYSAQRMYDSAQPYLERLATRREALPSDIELGTLRLLVETDRRAGRFANAAELQRRIIALAPPRLFAEWATLGELYLLAGQPSEAVPAFEKALTLEPLCYVARRHIGDLMIQSGQWEKALPEFEVLARHYPLHDPDIFLQLAQLYVRRGSRLAAQQVLAKARRLFPLSVEVWEAAHPLPSAPR
jgi:spermidine synthase